MATITKQKYMFSGRFFVPCKEPKCTSMVLEKELIWCDEHVPVCAICMENINLQSVDVCGHGHWFHVDCVVGMQEIKCPYCRRPPTTQTRQAVVDVKTQRLIQNINRLPVYVQEAFLQHSEELIQEL